MQQREQAGGGGGSAAQEATEELKLVIVGDSDVGVSAARLSCTRASACAAVVNGWIL